MNLLAYIWQLLELPDAKVDVLDPGMLEPTVAQVSPELEKF